MDACHDGHIRFVLLSASTPGVVTGGHGTQHKARHGVAFARGGAVGVPVALPGPDGRRQTPLVYEIACTLGMYGFPAGFDAAGSRALDMRAEASAASYRLLGRMHEGMKLASNEQVHARQGLLYDLTGGPRDVFRVLPASEASGGNEYAD